MVVRAGQEFELHGPPGLLLYDHSSRTNAAAGHQIGDPHFYDVATTQLPVNRESEESAVSEPPLDLEPRLFAVE
jgi:hypothetical protein